MARLVAAFGSSHSLMLASQREDWQHGFKQIDPKNAYYYDREGNKTDYASLLAAHGNAASEALVTPERMGERFDQAQAAMDELRKRIVAAKLDVLVLIGDDQTELFRTTNNPAFAIYWGKTIRNGAAVVKEGDSWVTRARMWRQEPGGDVEYPVESGMAEWLIRQLCERDFDMAAMDGLERGQFEGHAFSFIHRRYLQGTDLPVIPVIVNTFDPPNQPTPRRCIALGAALRELIAAYPEDLRVGVLASGGLSHFVVDEKLDKAIIEAIRRKDTPWLAALDPKKLQAGSSEIRNWLIGVEAVKDLDLEWVQYVPGYRTPALTGTGLASQRGERCRENTMTNPNVQRLRRLDCCAVSDALDKLKLPGVVTGLPQRSGSGRVAGIAITVKLGTGDAPPGPPKHLGCTAIEASGPDSVIVVEQRSGIEAGSWGGLLSLGAKVKGVAGVVADGPVRDVDEAIGYDFPVFSRGLTSFTARGRVVEKGTNVPVEIGSVTVRAGDYVLADRSAVIFIAAANIGRVLDTAEAIVAKEAAMAKAILAGTSIGEVMGGHYEHMLKD